LALPNPFNKAAATGVVGGSSQRHFLRYTAWAADVFGIFTYLLSFSKLKRSVGISVIAAPFEPVANVAITTTTHTLNNPSPKLFISQFFLRIAFLFCLYYNTVAKGPSQLNIRKMQL
jgi:hypothetical protein